MKYSCLSLSLLLSMYNTISLSMDPSSGTPASTSSNQQHKEINIINQATNNDLSEYPLSDSPESIHTQKIKKIMDQLKKENDSNDSQKIQSATLKGETLKIKNDNRNKICCILTCGLSRCFFKNH